MSSKSKLVVHPEVYNDKSVIDSMKEMLEGIVLPGSTTTRRDHHKLEEHVLWARFEECDLNDTHFNSEIVNVHQNQQEDYAPLVLLLGTTAGLQVWCIDPKGEAQLLMTYYEALVRHAKILPAPELRDTSGDAYASRRPFLVLSCIPHGSSSGQCDTVGFMSLRNKEYLRPATFDREIKSILSNKRFVVVCLNGRLVVYNNHDLKERIRILNSISFNEPDCCPVALGSRWLAFGDKKHEPLNQSLGGISTEEMTSYTGTIINVVDVVMQGLTYFGESAVSSLTGGATSGSQSARRHSAGIAKGGRPHGGRSPPSGEATPSSSSPGEEGGPGLVTVVDLLKLSCLALTEPVNVHHTDSDGLVAHFPAHAGAPVAFLRFDGSGQLLFSACRQGRDFHIYRLLPHPRYPQQAAVHHLYALHRGDTTAQVVDVSFTADSRWVAVSTRHGTTHVFPLTPYGGNISARTHAQSRVVNRTSRFLQSAGVDERTNRTQSGRESPATRAQPGSAPSHSTVPAGESQNSSHVPFCNSHNPRLPPFPHATSIQPYLQVKQTYAAINKWHSGLSQWHQNNKLSVTSLSSFTTSTGTASGSTTQDVDIPLPLVTTFSHPRARLLGQAPNTSYVRERERESKPPLDALFVVSCDGRLVEHFLDVRPHRDRPLSGSSSTFLTPSGAQQWNNYPQDGRIDLIHSPRAQWLLSQTRAVLGTQHSHGTRTVLVPSPPLINSHPLVASAEIVQQQHQRRSGGANSTPLSSSASSHCGGEFPSDGFGRTPSSDSLAHRPPSVDSLHSSDNSDESWLSHVEIVTHTGPHRRLWMGPQFTFKTYQSSSLLSSNSSSSVMLTLPESNSIQLGSGDDVEESAGIGTNISQLVRSHPLPAPRTAARGRNISGGSSTSCVYIEAGSFNDSFGSNMEGLEGFDEDAIRESLAEAMQESRSLERRTTPARDFIQESDFQNESWSSGSDCLDNGRISQRMQFPS